MIALWWFLLIFIIREAQGQGFVFITSLNGGNTEVFIDTSSIKVDGNTRRAQFKFINNINSKSYSENLMVRMEVVSLRNLAFNCEEKTYILESLTITYEGGLVEEIPATTDSTWSSVITDPAKRAMMVFVCK